MTFRHHELTSSGRCCLTPGTNAYPASPSTNFYVLLCTLQAGSMPDEITALTALETLCLSAPFAPRRGLPPGFGGLPLRSLTLWEGDLSGEGSTKELQGLTGLEVRVLLSFCHLLSCLKGDTAAAELVAGCQVRGSADGNAYSAPAFKCSSMHRPCVTRVTPRLLLAALCANWGS